MDISVYFSGQGMKIALGRSTPKKIIVKRLIVTPIERDAIINGVITNDISLKEDIKAVWKRYRLPKKNIRIVIDSSSVLVKPLTVPVTKRENLNNIIRHEFSDVGTAEEMLVDYSVEDPHLENGGASVIAYAADRAFIGSYIDLFSEIKAEIKSINVSQNSCIKFLKLTGVTQDSNCILAVIDGNILSLLLFVNGIYRFSNRSRLISEKGTSEYTDEIAAAISSIIQFNKSERSGDITDIYFCGSDSRSRELINMTSMLFERQRVCELIIPEKKVILKGSLALNPAEYIYCLGNLIGE